MKMDAKQQTERDFRDLVDDVISSKNTNSLYQLKSQIERNLKDKSIHNRSLILESIKKLRNLVTSKLLESVLKKAIEIDDYELCAEIVRSVQILEEKHVVDCLKYFLKDIKSDYEVDNVVESKLDLVFQKTYDYRLLTMELKNLSSNEFIICLQYLRKYLKKSFHGNEDSSENQQDISDDQSDSKPTILQIVDLFACFIDAHFTHITLLPVAQEIVLDSLQLIETQLDLFTDMTAIEALVKEMKRNKQFRVKDNNDINYYFVEVLKL